MNVIKKRSIKSSIITSFIFFTLLTMIAIGFISLAFIERVSDTTITQSSDALQTQIQRNILLTSKDNAEIIHQKFSNAEAMVKMMANEIEMLFSSNNRYDYRQSYYDYFFEEYNPDPSLIPSDLVYDPNYQINVSWNYASYYFDGSTHLNYHIQTPELNQTIQAVANLDHVFRYIHMNMPEFRWLYAAIPLADTTLFVNYPGSIVGGTLQDRIDSPYVAVDEDWYQDVLEGDGEIVFTEPYFDEIDGIPLITIGQVVNKPNGDFLGVICGDITIQDIVDEILDIQVLETGYASLITSSGLVVAHKDSIPEIGEIDFKTIDEVEANDDETAALTNEQIDAITSGETGVTKFEKNGEMYYLAYRAVGLGDYISLIIVPESEALEALKPLENRMTSTQITTRNQIIIVIALTAVIAVIVGLVVANYLVRPIERLKEIVNRLSMSSVSEDPLDALDSIYVDKNLTNRQDETGELARGVQNVIDWYKSSFNDKK